MQPGTYGSTYGGNPLACAVGAVLQEVGAGFLAQGQDSAVYFRQNLARLLDENSDIFADLRGRGLMIGMQCKIANNDVVAALRDENLLTVGAGDNVLRILPPLNVTQDEIDTAIAALEKACAKLRAGA